MLISFYKIYVYNTISIDLLNRINTGFFVIYVEYFQTLLMQKIIQIIVSDKNQISCSLSTEITIFVQFNIFISRKV